MREGGVTGRSGGFRERLAAWRVAAGAFLRWWVGELAGMLPPRLRERFRFADRRIELYSDGASMRVVALALEEPVLERQVDIDSAQLDDTLAQARQELGRDCRLVLRLQPPQSLVREIRLPAAASENLAQVLRYEMDRHTPFTADAVYYGYRLLGRAPDNTLRVQLAVVLRQRLDQWLDRLHARGIYPDRVVADEAPALNLAPSTGRKSRTASGVAMQRALGGAVVLALVAVLVLPLWFLRDTAIQLMHEAGQVRAVAMQTERLREERDALEHQARYLVSRKQEQPSTLRVLEELTATLPDDTWLRDMQMRGDRIVIQGLSASASGLIERIESSPLFEDVSFAAPVTTDSRSGSDSFQISLHVRAEGV